MIKNVYDEYIKSCIVTTVLSETIEAKYDRHLASFFILNEEYEELKLTPNNIKASFIKVIYNCQKLNVSANDEVIDHLNSEFLKGNIEFILNSPYINSIPKYPNSGILNSDADSNGLISIYVNNKFINILKNLDLTKENKQFNELIEDTFKSYSHEITHTNQFSKQVNLQNGIDPNEIKTNLQNLKYLADYREIDSRARELATTFLLEGKTFDDIKNMFETDSKKLLKYKDYYNYWINFGYKKLIPNKGLTRKQKQDKKKAISVFNRFKRRVFDFILLDKKYINKGNLIYTINNKKD